MRWRGRGATYTPTAHDTPDIYPPTGAPATGVVVGRSVVVPRSTFGGFRQQPRLLRRAVVRACRRRLHWNECVTGRAKGGGEITKLIALMSIIMGTWPHYAPKQTTFMIFFIRILQLVANTHPNEPNGLNFCFASLLTTAAPRKVSITTDFATIE